MDKFIEITAYDSVDNRHTKRCYNVEHIMFFEQDPEMDGHPIVLYMINQERFFIYNCSYEDFKKAFDVSAVVQKF
ncbi:MAG: hypothetical protein LUC22_02940 [Prevotella sp.]|nr:hypothetical protein [Prevotella sp.]